MDRVKDTIPTIEALNLKISAGWPVFEQKVTDILGSARADYSSARRNLLLVLSVVSAIVLVVYLLAIPADFWGWFFVGVIAFGAVYNSVRRFSAASRWYTFQLDKLIHEYVFEVLALSATHRKVLAEEVRGTLTQSGLVTDRVDDYIADDLVTGTYFGGTVAVAELHLTRTEKQGKNTTTVEVFKGILASYDLPTTLAGATYISTEGDKYGFAHRSFWSALTNTNMVAETELEWNDFERDLHVATDNPTEARYILTPDFMLDLHTWWTARKINIRIAFKGNKLYILFPDRKLSIGYGTTTSKSIKLQRYTTTIAEPIWHILHLLDDVRTRFK